ncbi:MAG: hypothetical protein QXI93_05035 [Candidatus Methanomethylicia archaeon]
MSYTCSNCGASFNIPEGITIVTCPYCGMTINISIGKLDVEHYFYPTIYDTQRAYNRLKSILSRQFGVPRDFSDQLNLISRVLHYIPLYVFYVEGKTSSGSVEVLEYDYVALPSLKMPPVPIPEDYRFPVRGKVYFKPQIIKDAHFYSPTISRDELEKIARAKVYARFSRELDLAGRGLEANINSRCEGLVHYPIWEFKYNYLNFSFNGFVDAVNGEVLYCQYLVSTMHRTFSLSLAIGIVGLGVALGFSIGLLLSAPFIGLFGGLSSSLFGAIPLFMKSAYKFQTYVLKVFGVGEKEKSLGKELLDAIKFVSRIGI